MLFPLASLKTEAFCASGHTSLVFIPCFGKVATFSGVSRAVVDGRLFQDLQARGLVNQVAGEGL